MDISFFDDIQCLDGINGFEVNSLRTHALNAKYGFILVKHNGFFYVENVESEPSFFDDHVSRIYELGTKWYMMFDYAKWEKDLHNNDIDPNDFSVFDYELSFKL